MNGYFPLTQNSIYHPQSSSPSQSYFKELFSHEFTRMKHRSNKMILFKLIEKDENAGILENSLLKFVSIPINAPKDASASGMISGPNNLCKYF